MQPQVPPPPGAPRRLTRSSRDRMWAGVAGGLGEYFDVDPVLVRLIWVAAAVFTGGLAIPVYILFWIIMPRDDQAPRGAPGNWHAWSQDFQTETRRIAEEARRLADDVAQQVQTGWRTDEPGRAKEEASVETPGSAEPARAARESAPDAEAGPATIKGSRSSESAAPPPSWSAWETTPMVHHDRESGRQRVAGVILVGLGLLFLAHQLGLLRPIPWHLVWPLILVAAGVGLLLKQGDWRH
ncbi:MAG TPA: PspC domain-containing protein [Chloroflexota bacterium]|nr:PspC domain-containing protein [Chloroflexota bacterium]